MQGKDTPPICPGQKVLILYPGKALGQAGIVLEPETGSSGAQTGYWLIQTEASQMILALTPSEFAVLSKPSR